MNYNNPKTDIQKLELNHSLCDNMGSPNKPSKNTDPEFDE